MALTKINSSVIANNTIAVGNIADNSVDATKIASNSILTRHIDDAQITTDQILDGTIATADIADDAITAAKLANSINTDIAAKAPLAGPTFTGDVDIDGSDDLRLRFLNGSTFKGGIQVPTSTGDMISGAAVDDLAIRSQANMLFSTGGNTERVRIDSSGKVGIGTTSPQAHLDINTETAEATTVILNGEANQDKILKFRHYANSEAAGDGYAGFIGSVVDNVLTLGHLNSSNTEVQVLHVTEGGDVGIGDSSPDAKLHINQGTAASGGSGDQTNANNLALYLENSGSNGYPRIVHKSTSSSVASVTNAETGKDMYWGESTDTGNYYFRGRDLLVTDGDVGIGTSSPDSHVTIDGGSDVRAELNLRSQTLGTTYNGGTIRFKGYHASVSDGSRIWFEIRGQKENNTGGDVKGRIEMYINPGNNSMTEVMKIESNGDTYTNDGTVHSLASDSRVKSDVADLTDGLTILNQLRPVTYKYNTKSEFYNPIDETTTRYGFIADEVKTVAPQYIKEGEGKVDGVKVDDFKTLSQTKMIPMLVKSIQEQQTIIDDLKARIETLEG